MSISAKIASAYELSDQPHRVLAMEGLRGLAVLLVFFVHFHALFGLYIATHPAIFSVSRFLGDVGNAGVDLFFVLSGYLIYGAVVRKRTPYLRFIRRRIERIYPAFLAVFCLYLALSPLFPSDNKIHGSFLHSLAYVCENVLLLPGIFHITPIITVAWSLSYEFFFYIFIPVVVWLCAIRRWRRSHRVAFFVGISILYLMHAFTSPESRVRLLMFVSGILLYELSGSKWITSKLNRRGELGAIALFAACFAFIYIYDVAPGWLSFLPGTLVGRTVLPGITSFQGPYKVIALGLACPLLALYSFHFRGALETVFSWAPLRYLGNMSYSYYLIHGLALHALALPMYAARSRGVPAIGIFVLALPLGLAASWVASTGLFLLVEKPLSLRSVPTKTVIHSPELVLAGASTGLHNPKMCEPASGGH